MTDQTRPTNNRHDDQHERHDNDRLRIEEASAILRTPKASLRY
jgi:hypothetical protein